MSFSPPHRCRLPPCWRSSPPSWIFPPRHCLPEDYARLVGLLDTPALCSIFAMLGLADGAELVATPISCPDVFKQQLGREEPRLTEQLTRLDEGQGWLCSLWSISTCSGCWHGTPEQAPP